MIVEKIDPNSGAILFKKDKESINLEKALKRIDELEARVGVLEALISDIIIKVDKKG